MKVTQAIITAAAPSQRSLPLQSLVDRQGQTRTALAILVSEIIEAGISRIAVIVHPGDEEAYAEAVGSLSTQVEFIAQDPPGSGYGHAIRCAAEFTGDQSFLLTVSDHLYTSGGDQSCIAQLLATAEREACAVSAVAPTHESKLPFYGCVGGNRVTNSKQLYEISQVIEKPTPTEAEQKLVVPGLRSGNYLAFFGMHVLTPSVMAALLGEDGKALPNLSLAMDKISRNERYLAHEICGQRHDLDRSYGILKTQLALALSGKDRDEVLSLIIEQLAQSNASQAPHA